MTGETEIQKADPAARRRAVLVVATTAVAGSLLILWYQRGDAAIVEWLLATLPEAAERPTLLLAICVACFLPLLATCGYLFQQGRRIVAARRQPAPGLRVVRDTPVVRGARAVRRGRLLQGLAVLMGVLWLVAAGLIWWMLLEIARMLTAP